MKNLIALITLLTSLSSFAGYYSDYQDCSGVLTQELWAVQDGEGVDVIYDIDAEISAKEFNSTPVFNDGFEYKYCKNALTELVVMDMNGNEYKILHTHDDVCDGGNSYGVVYDMNTNKIIAHIHDGEFSWPVCLAVLWPCLWPPSVY